MIKLIFATSNQHKLTEVKKVMPKGIQIESMAEAGYLFSIPETGFHLENNALEKVLHLSSSLNNWCFSEDTGLEVKALGGRPGTHTARYAGPYANPESNMNKLLSEMKRADNRTARFRTVICLFIHNKYYYFEGIINGHISMSQSGKRGFGYDPIFIPEGHDNTFGDLDEKIKQSISHRSRAVQAMASFLATNFNNKTR